MRAPVLYEHGGTPRCADFDEPSGLEDALVVEVSAAGLHHLRAEQVVEWATLVNGRVVKHGHRLVGIDIAGARQSVERTIEYAISQLGEDAWRCQV